MALPTTKTLTRGKVNERDFETRERIWRDETDEELAFRQQAYDDLVNNWSTTRITDLVDLCNGQRDAVEWTQLVDTCLTSECQAAFTTYRQALADLAASKGDYLDSDGNPNDYTEAFWDPENTLIDFLPTEPDIVWLDGYDPEKGPGGFDKETGTYGDPETPPSE